MAENLHVKVSGSGDSNLVLLHGLFGSANNLGQLARAFKDDHVVYSVDLPDHGRSDWLSESSIENYTRVVAHWLVSSGVGQSRVLGHSLGGKVAMQLAQDFPSLVEGLVVMDIAPVAYAGRHDSVFNALRAVLREGAKSRTEAKAIMKPLLDDARIADFLLTNAHIGQKGLIEWRFNLEGLQSGYQNILSGIVPSRDNIKGFSGPALVLRGELSDYVSDGSGAEFFSFFSQIDVVTVTGAGHWLHQERAEVVKDAVRQFFDTLI